MNSFTENFKIFLIVCALVAIAAFACLTTGCATAPVESTQVKGIISIVGYGDCDHYQGAVVVDKQGRTLDIPVKQMPFDAAKAIADSLPDSHVEVIKVCTRELSTQR